MTLPFQFCSLKHTLFWGPFPLPLCSSVWQMSHRSGMPNILGSPTQSRLHFTVLQNGLSGPPWRDFPDTFPAAGALLNCGGRFHSPFTHVTLHDSEARMTRMTLPNLTSNWGEPWCSRITSAVALVCCSFLRAENSLGLLLSQVGGLVRWGLALKAPFPYSILDQASA